MNSPGTPGTSLGGGVRAVSALTWAKLELGVPGNSYLKFFTSNGLFRVLPFFSFRFSSLNEFFLPVFRACVGTSLGVVRRAIFRFAKQRQGTGAHSAIGSSSPFWFA
jgi:hypothetical protein